MTTETISVTSTISASVEAVFAALADPATHVAIDGTGWVEKSLDDQLLTESGQVFRMTMYHPNHPDGHYEMANRVRTFDPPHAISWEPGQDPEGDGNLRFGGWIWRYDLASAGPSQTEVELSYDWSAVPPSIREYLQFPPFPADHLANSLEHLAEIVVSRESSGT